MNAGWEERGFVKDEASRSSGPFDREPSLSVSLALNPLAVIESSAFEDSASKSSIQVSVVEIRSRGLDTAYNRQGFVHLLAQSQLTRASRTHYSAPSAVARASAASREYIYVNRVSFASGFMRSFNHYPRVTRIFWSRASNSHDSFRFLQASHGCVPEHLIFWRRHLAHLRLPCQLILFVAGPPSVTLFSGGLRPMENDERVA